MLQLAKTLVNQLNSDRVCYCHWKSNARLKRGLSGLTDLDLLVYEKEKKKFDTILKNLDFKKIISSPQKQYPGMEDYLGFDYETGKLCHLHVHYKLILGQKHIKNHHLPIENIILSDLRILDSVYVPSAEMELLLLVIRSCMKLSIINILQYFLQNKKSLFPKNILNELRFLINDYKQDKFRDVLLKSGLPLSESRLLTFIEKLNNETSTIANILLLRFHIFKSLRSFRYQGRVRSYKKASEIVLHLLPGLKKLWPMPRKRLSGIGKSFALVGADGAGKTTLVKDLAKWLSWKMQVRILYFGIPKTLVLKMVNKLISFLRLPGRIGLEKTFAPVINLGYYISAHRWIWIAQKRLDLSHQLEEFSATGGISIADRYPLPEFRHMITPMDGHRIRNEWGIDGKKWAEHEEWCYSHIGLPTKVFVLRTSFDELRRRKNDLDLVTHKEKAEATNAINNSSGVCIINANESYPKVLLNIKREIWKLL